MITRAVRHSLCLPPLSMTRQVLPDLKYGKCPDDTTCRMLFELPGDVDIAGTPGATPHARNGRAAAIAPPPRRARAHRRVGRAIRAARRGGRRGDGRESLLCACALCSCALSRDALARDATHHRAR